MRAKHLLAVFRETAIRAWDERRVVWAFDLLMGVLLERDSRSALHSTQTTKKMSPTMIAAQSPALLPRIARSHSTQVDRPLRQLRKALDACGYPELSAVECSVEEENVVLSGRVSSFYLKQLAQATVLRTVRGSRVRNLLRVDS